MKRHALDLEPGRRPRHGINIAGLAAVLVLFAAATALGHWVDTRLQAPPAARPAQPDEAQTLTLSPDSVPAAQTPFHDPAAREQSAHGGSALSGNDIVIMDAQQQPAPAPAPDAAHPRTAPRSRAAAQPAPARSVSPPAPPRVADAIKAASKPPAQSNPAIKPTSSKPVAVSPAATADRVVRVQPPAHPAATEPFYSVRLNKAESKVLADVVADTLKKHGFDDAAAVRTTDGQYSVKVGDFNFRYAAENAKKQLQDLGFQETYIEEKTVAE